MGIVTSFPLWHMYILIYQLRVKDLFRMMDSYTFMYMQI